MDVSPNHFYGLPYQLSSWHEDVVFPNFPTVFVRHMTVIFVNTGRLPIIAFRFFAWQFKQGERVLGPSIINDDGNGGGGGENGDDGPEGYPREAIEA
ncbi:AP2/ERF domain-containing protein [Psidium guajava]|nr:AP2/ERF domain-containing protein [Psidium guajava]